MKRSITGFTIVELLIVIVVIAILASISVVAYAGIQNRANDTAVQSDISNYAKKVMLAHAESGEYPAGRSTASPIGVGDFPLSKDSYLVSDSAGNALNNFYYCVGTVSGTPAFAVGAVSKSNTRYYHSYLQGNVQQYTGSWNGVSSGICPSMLPGLEAGWSFSYGHGRNTGSGGSPSWHSWTQTS